ncbi:MAG: hypothetical protein KAX44_05895, partial [Candidatus Brocadiae bacterium]|nr:hypothetical protein [Candidatus Brocadiia bacterium]
NWALKKARFIPFVRSADVALLAVAPALEDLLDTVGPGRTAQQPERVAAAECELRERLARAHEDRIRRVRRWGLTAIILGLYFAIASAGALLTATRVALRGPEAYPVVGRGAASILYFWTAFWMAVINPCFGLGLLACGLGLRKRREWARRTLIWILWMWLASGVVVAPLMAGWMLMTGAQARDLLIMLALALPIAAFWVAMFRSITKALASVATREVCRPSQGEQGPEAPGKFRRRMLLAAAVATMVLLAPLVAYGIWWRNSAAGLRTQFQQLRKSGAVLNLREWKPPLPSPEHNAADLLRKAAAQMEQAEGRIRDSGSPVPELPGGEELEDWADLLELKAWTPAQADYARRVLSHHADALESLRMASARPHADFDWDYSALVPILDGLHQLRRGVRLMCLSALSAHREQNHAQAVADIATALRLAQFPDGDPFLVVHMGRISCATLAVRCCETLLQTADIPAGLLVGLDRPLGGAGRGLDPARALACERAWFVGAWEAVESGNWELLNMAPPGALKALIVRPLLMSRMAAALPLTTEAVRIAQKPTWEAVPKMQELEREIEHADAALHWQGAIAGGLPHPIELLPLYESCTEPYADCKALLDSMRVAIALRRYKADKGRPAPRLDGLVPDYLSQLPRDPFTGSDLLVGREGGLVSVYSVGANMQDDGGEVQEPEYYRRPDMGVQIRE